MIGCIKTGFYAKLPDRLFAYGDAFALNSETFITNYDDKPRKPRDILLLQIRSVSNEYPGLCQIKLDTYEQWFNQLNYTNVAGQGDGIARLYQHCSTLIADADQWHWLGYKGKEV